MGRQRRSNHTGNEAEIRGQPVIESVDDISQESARLGAMPRLALLSSNSRESRRMLRRFFRERESLSTTGRSSRDRAMHVEVRLYFASLFLKKHRQQKTGTEQFSDASKHFRATTRAKWLR